MVGRSRRKLILSLWLAALCVLTACSADNENATGGSDEVVTMLAGSEVRDLEPVLAEMKDEIGVELRPTYSGTLEGADRIRNGEAVDTAFFSSSRYLDLLEGGRDRIRKRERIMVSPVVLGVKQSVAQRFGWADNPNVTWNQIAERAKSGELRYAMTNPTASNSGFTALVGVASAFAASGSALEAGDIDAGRMRDFFAGQKLTAGSSGFLTESYVREQDQLDGMVNYESVLLGLNSGSQLREKFSLIYPQEGIASADYPLMLINEAKRGAYDRVVEYLKRPATQRQIMATTSRRPVVSDVPTDPKFGDRLLVELPFPSRLETVNALLVSYLDTVSRPSRTIFVLDTSGSMQGERIEQMKRAVTQLTGTDTSITGQFARLRNREQVTLLPFSSEVGPRSEYTIEGADPQSAERVELRNAVQGLRAVGGTAIFSALEDAYSVASEAVAREPDRFTSIVLLSDGENTVGASSREFENFFATLTAEAKKVRTFAVVFGDASEAELEGAVALSGGRVFDGRTGALADVFKEIRGYQ